ncbi:MAG: hypothetical protein ACC645_16725 [Pirellulales bacterium]
MARYLLYEQLEARCLMAATQVGGEILVNEQAYGRQLLEAGTEAIGVFDDGGFVAAFSGRGPTDRAGVYVRRFQDDGTPLGSATLVNSTTAGDQSSPTVATFRDGSFVVAWAGRGRGDRHGVFAQWFNLAGDKIGSETRVNTTVGGWQLDPQVASTPSGQTMIAWHGTGDGDLAGVFSRSFASDRSPLGSERRVNSTTADQQANPSIAGTLSLVVLVPPGNR